MAKKKTAPKAAPTQEQPQPSVSKMEAIKQVLAKGIESPKEIVKQVKREFGIKVRRVYVSRFKARTKSPASSKKEQSPPPSEEAAKSDGLDAAIAFWEDVGGVEAAKTLLEKIERIKRL